MRARRAVVSQLLWAAALVVALLVDRAAFAPIRAFLLYDHLGEVREALTAAKFLGSGLGSALVVAIVWALDSRGWRRALVLALAVATAGGAAGVLKIATGRERPSHLDQAVGEERVGFHGPARGLEAPFESFPSGHVTGAFAAATTLAAFYPPARVVFYAVATGTALNRVVKHQHFLSDVVAGAWLGRLVSLWLLSVPRLRRFAGRVDSRQRPS